MKGRALVLDETIEGCTCALQGGMGLKIPYVCGSVYSKTNDKASLVFLHIHQSLLLT